MSYWLKLVGASDWHCDQHPFTDDPELKNQVRFPKDKFPGTSMTVGDKLVYYAVGGWKRVFAVVEVIEPPQRDVPTQGGQVDARWPHAVRVIRTEDWLDDVAKAPTLSSISRTLQGEIQQGVSHLPMGHHEFEAARAAIRKARV